MINPYQMLTCHQCKKKRNLVWDPKHKVCYDCLMKNRGVNLEAQKNWMTHSSNPAWNQIKGARNIAHLSNKPPVFVGWAAPPKSGKTGSALDSLTDEEKANGAEVHLHDFDTAGETTKSAHHGGSANIVVLDPWVIDPDSTSRIPYDFPATYQKVMDILRAQIEMADKQNEYFRQHGRMPSPYLKTVVFDGADQWLNICETLMKVEDLGLGVDGISVSYSHRRHIETKHRQ